jgi:glycosyltransferase involved in cell wall biosynthesis
MPTIADLFFLPWAAIILVSTISAWRYAWGLPRPEVPGYLASVVIIVPVKGATATTRACFDRLLGLAYPRFRLIVAVEAEDDPAVPMIRSLAVGRPGKITLVVAGLARETGQKVANLVAALDAIEPRDEIVVFTDADTLPDPNWLSRLVSAIVDAGFRAVTGYRWMVPIDGSASSAVVAAANTSIVTLPRLPNPINLCWGGTMALRRETLEEIDIKKYWTGALSDDLQMTRALHDHGIKVFSPRQSLLLSPVAFDWASGFAFGVRQYRLLFWHFPLLWSIAAVFLLAPVLSGTFAVIRSCEGDFVAVFMIVLALACGEIRFRRRRMIAAALWGLDQAGYVGLTARIDRWLRPLWFGFHAACLVAAPWSRKISWAGIDYVLHGPQDVEIRGRPSSPATSGRTATAHRTVTVD